MAPWFPAWRWPSCTIFSSTWIAGLPNVAQGQFTLHTRIFMTHHDAFLLWKAHDTSLLKMIYVCSKLLCTVVPGVPIHCWVILQLSAEASRLIWRTRSAVCAGGFGQLRCGCCRPSLDQNREPVSASASVFSAFCLSILRFRLWDCKHPSVTSSMLDSWWIFHVNSSKPRSIEALHVMFFPHHSNFVKICQTSRHTEMGC